MNSYLAGSFLRSQWPQSY